MKRKRIGMPSCVVCYATCFNEGPSGRLTLLICGIETSQSLQTRRYIHCHINLDWNICAGKESKELDVFNL